VSKCFKGDSESQWENWNLTPRGSNPPKNRHQNCRGWLRRGHVQNLVPIGLGFLPPYVRSCPRKWLGYFIFFGRGGYDNSLPPRRLHRFWRSIRQTMSFRARMCLLGSRKQIFTFWPHFPQERRLWRNFLTGLRKIFSLKIGVNSAGSEREHPLVVKLRLWKLDVE